MRIVPLLLAILVPRTWSQPAGWPGPDRRPPLEDWLKADSAVGPALAAHLERLAKVASARTASYIREALQPRAEHSAATKAAAYLGYALVHYESEHRLLRSLLVPHERGRDLFGTYVLHVPAEQDAAPAPEPAVAGRPSVTLGSESLERLSERAAEGGRDAFSGVFDGGVRDTEGPVFEHETSLLGGSFGRSREGGGLLRHETSLEWGGLELAAEGYLLKGSRTPRDPDSGRGASEDAYNLGVGLSLRRPLGESGSLLLEGGWDRDDFLGMASKSEVRLGYGRKLFETDIHELEVEGNFGYVRERTLTGEGESFPSPGFAVEYALKPVYGLRVFQRVHADMNLRNARDWDFQSLTGIAWELSEKAAVELAYWIKGRTERIEGFEGVSPRWMVGVSVKY